MRHKHRHALSLPALPAPSPRPLPPPPAPRPPPPHLNLHPQQLVQIVVQIVLRILIGARSRRRPSPPPTTACSTRSSACCSACCPMGTRLCHHCVYLSQQVVQLVQVLKVGHPPGRVKCTVRDWVRRFVGSIGNWYDRRVEARWRDGEVGGGWEWWQGVDQPCSEGEIEPRGTL